MIVRSTPCPNDVPSRAYPSSLWFASDLHLTPNSPPIYKRVLRWLRDQVENDPACLAIFGGDLLQSGTSGLPQLLHVLGSEAARGLWLDGNRDPGLGDALVRRSMVPASCTTRGVMQIGEQHVLAWIDTKASKLELEDLQCLLDVPRQTHLLVATHVPVGRLDTATCEALRRIVAQRNADSLWVSGHVHEDVDAQQHGWRVVTTRGLDPCRAGGGGPGCLRLTVVSQGFFVERHVVSEAELGTSPCRNLRLGVACKDDLHAVAAKAIEHGLEGIQLYPEHFDRCDPLLMSDLLDAWRDRVGDAFLSVHLPNPDFTSAEATRRLWSIAERSFALGVVDFTAHLPKGPAPRFVDVNGRWSDQQQLNGYGELAETVLTQGARLNLENIHNPPDQQPDDNDLLSTRPEHLRLFVKTLRHHWREQTGGDPAWAKRIAMTFDVGHARNNGQVGKQIAPVDWIPPLQDLIQTLHVHQVLPVNGRLRNHQPITDAHGPLINYRGLLRCLLESDGPDCFAFAEVRDTHGAIASWLTLRRIMAHIAVASPDRSSQVY